MSDIQPPAGLSSSEFAVVRTLAYSALFDFPLTVEELARGLLEFKMEKEALLPLYRSSRSLQKLFQFERGHFFLKGREDQLEIRRRRSLHSRRLLGQNRWLLKLLCSIPFTRMVALSGSSAHLNVDDGGDIDLFIVTRGERVWSAAVQMLLLTRLLGRRQVFCFNFLLSDTRLRLDQQDLFTAHQMISLQPLSGHDVYRRLLDANPFARDYYPNFSIDGRDNDRPPSKFLHALKTGPEWLLRPGLSALLESFCRALYRRHLLRRSQLWKSPEEVVLGRDVLKLHTESHRRRVQQQFDRLMTCLLAKLDS